MNQDEIKIYQVKIRRSLELKNHNELAAGFLRYEVLRKLNVTQFKELNQRNLAGENFDEMIDKLVTQP